MGTEVSVVGLAEEIVIFYGFGYGEVAKGVFEGTFCTSRGVVRSEAATVYSV